MSENDDFRSEWDQLIADWQPVWDEWIEVMNRLNLAFIGSGIPSQEDLDLEEKLNKQLDEARTKMKEYQAFLINRQRG